MNPMTRLAILVSATAAMTWVTADASADVVRDRLSIGIHASGGGIGDSDDEDAEQLDVGGAGLTARYAVSRRWDIELSAEGLVGENDELRRSLGIFTLAGRFRFNPTARWRWSMLAGLGSADEEVEVLNSAGDAILTREFRHGVVTLGGGLERRFGRVGLSAELRVMGLVLDEEELDGPEFAGKNSLIPENSTAGEVRFQATYYF